MTTSTDTDTDDTDEQPVKTPPITICNSSSRTEYAGSELTSAPARPRASNALAIPSRVGNRLHHRCIRTTDLAGNPINPEATPNPGERC